MLGAGDDLSAVLDRLLEGLDKIKDQWEWLELDLANRVAELLPVNQEVFIFHDITSCKSYSYFMTLYHVEVIRTFLKHHFDFGTVYVLQILYMHLILLQKVVHFPEKSAQAKV